MREAVICNPLRTPIGRYGGKLRDVDAETLAQVVVQRLLEDTKLDGSIGRRLHIRPVLPQHGGPGDRSSRRAGAGLPVRSAGLPGRPPLRLRSSGHLHGGHAGADRRRRCGHRRRRREHEHRRLLRHFRPLGPEPRRDQSRRRPEQRRVTAGSRRYPVPGGMLETAENVRRQYGISRQGQDEYALRSHQRARRRLGRRQVPGRDRARGHQDQGR